MQTNKQHNNHATRTQWRSAWPTVVLDYCFVQCICADYISEEVKVNKVVCVAITEIVGQ